MSFAIWEPTLPASDSGHAISEEERFIDKKCWGLPKIVEALDAGTLTVSLTTKAQSESLAELKYMTEDVVALLKNLAPRHYVNSQWCLPPADGNQHAPYPSDSYSMGFDRIKKDENARREPHVYIKFAVNEVTKKLIVFSLHPKR